MKEAWREVLEQVGPVAPEAEALAGDVGLLVPLSPTWRVLDLSKGEGARAAVLANWCGETFAVVSDPAREPVLAARVAAHEAEGGGGRLAGVVAGAALPFEAQSFDLIVIEGEEPWSIEQVHSLLRPGGYLIWLVEGTPHPPLDLSRPAQAVKTVGAFARWLPERLSGANRWKARLAAAGYRLSRIYVNVREYAWGYLPFEAHQVHRYYLESIQEDAQGDGRGRARIARMTGRAGVYPYLVSGYAVVARKNP